MLPLRERKNGKYTGVFTLAPTDNSDEAIEIVMGSKKWIVEQFKKKIKYAIGREGRLILDEGLDSHKIISWEKNYELNEDTKKYGEHGAKFFTVEQVTYYVKQNFQITRIVKTVRNPNYILKNRSES